MAIDSSSFFGAAGSPSETAAGKRSMLAGSQAKGLGRIGVVEKKVAINARKITSLKSILVMQKENTKGGNLKEALQDQEATIFKINHNVGGILEALKAEAEAAEDLSDEERQERELGKRKKKEDDKEKGASKLKTPGFISTMTKPLTDLWGNILKWFTTLFAGWAIDKMLKWVSDKKNRDAVDDLKEFITVALPPILKGILALVALDIGLKVLGFVAMLAKGTISLLVGLKSLFVKTMAALASNPWLAATLGITALGVGIGMMQRKGEERVADVTGDESFTANTMGSGLPVPVIPSPDKESPSLGRNPFESLFNEGGFVSGPEGVDRVPAKLTAGEFVMSKGAVQEYGEDTLAGMNAAAGGTNLPKRANGIMYAAGGGGVHKTAAPMIKDHEGFRSQMYKDTEGNNTIGYGHLVKPDEIDRFKNGITKAEAEELFKVDYFEHALAASKIPGYAKASEKQKAAVIDLTYNMGPGWHKGFPKFSKAFAEGDYSTAASELQNSDWYDQVARRGPIIVGMIRGADNIRGGTADLQSPATSSANQLIGSPPGGGGGSRGSMSAVGLPPMTPPPPLPPPAVGADNSQPMFSPNDPDNLSSVVIRSLYGVLD